ncbi:unnamed protein product [Rhodiola kirilowii]
MMEDDDGRSFHYNQLIFHQHQQQDMLTQPPFASSSFNPTIVYNPLLIPPPPSLYSYSDQHMNSDLTDGQSATLFGSSMVGNMLSHEFEKMRSMDMMEDKALAASRSHSEARGDGESASTATLLNSAAFYPTPPKRTRHPCLQKCSNA